MKKVFALLLIIVLVIGLAGCGNTQSSGESATKDTPTIERSIDAVAEALGFENGDDVYYSMIGAIDGKQYVSNDKEYEIYQYELKSSEYQKIVDGKTTNGIAFTAYNNGFALLCFDKDDKKTVSTFEGLNIGD